jgi:flagellar motor switch protein FliG
MDKIKNAAIIILGMGEKCASEILKNMNPKEVQQIMEAINTIDNVSETDVIKALNSFFKDSNHSGIDHSAKETMKNSLESVVRMNSFGDSDKSINTWVALIKSESVETIVDLIDNEHPQIIAAILVVLNKISSDKASNIAKRLPKALQNQVIKRLSCIRPISSFAMETISSFFENELSNVTERYDVISVDGIEAAASIMSALDSDTEREIIADLLGSNKELAEQIQDKILPFDGLAKLDKKSLQMLLKEVSNDDLVLALKGVDEHIKNTFMKSMSSKSADILKDEMETKGPVKLASVVEAQKRIVMLAKKLGEEEKIVLSSKNNPDIVF